MRLIGTIAAIAAAGLVAACGGSSYFNPATGQTISAYGPTDNPDLTACREEYQRAFAQYSQAWMGEIVPDCMKMRGWVQK
jgi:ABC-type glycerol-3-phosphate transport system substrate-binding protein